MPVRIYSLAKELSLDSKVLVEVCQKAGVQGKGSALASLSDEEADRVRDFLQSAPTRSSSRPAPGPAPPSVATASRVRTLTSRARPSRPAPAEPSGAEAEPAPPETAEVAPSRVPPAEEPAPAEATSAEAPPEQAPPEKAAPEAPSEPEAPEKGAEQPAEESKPSPLAPAAKTGAPQRPSPGPSPGAARSGPLRNLTARLKRRDGDKRSDSGRSDEGAGPIVRVGRMPTPKHPDKPKADKAEPTQKPDIKLPMDAIKRGGSGALKDHVQKIQRKAEEQATEKSRETPTRRPRRPGAAEETPGKDPFSREERAHKRKRSRQRRNRDDGYDREAIHRRMAKTRLKRRRGINTAAPRKSRVVVQLPSTVKSFCEDVGVPVGDVLRILMQSVGPGAAITSTLDPETAELLAEELEIDVEFRLPADPEEELRQQFEELEDAPEDLRPRPPVVTFLGHVDHGKTSLLDRIMGANVVEGEAGGITQHIRAYKVGRGDKQVAFVDTPGHEAFTEMRARGANVTDIAVLVVAADDGVMPQTEEAISHARAAGVPILVALNKTDLPGVDINRIMQQLAAHELLPSEWGGETEVIRCSALTGEGIDELLDTILTIAELHEYKSNPTRPATGYCIEAERHEGRGVVAKFLVKNGTLRVGDYVLCGPAYGRVKAMYDTVTGARRLKKAGPSTPVNLTGLDEVPGAGDRFYQTHDQARARQIAEKRRVQTRQLDLAGRRHITLDTIYDRLEGLGADETQNLNIILRADVRGSIEAIQKEFAKLDHPEVHVKILQALVGGVSEADVHLADASDAIIIAFNVVPDERARQLADRKGVEIRRYDIIYRVTEDLKLALEGMLRPEELEVELGSALVQRVFAISRIGSIAGCRVVRGTIKREAGARARVIRNNTIIGDYPLDSLKREKDDVREVREGLECGVKLAGFNDVKEGDLLDVYKIEEKARKLEQSRA